MQEPKINKEIKWSYSRLGCYKECGFKYKLKYVDKNYVYSPSIATEFGTSMHEALESIANCIKDNLPIDYTSIKNKYILANEVLHSKYPDDWFTADKYSHKTYDEKYKDFRDNGIYRLEQYLKDHPSYKIVGAELPIDFMFEDKYRFIGAIDRLIFDTDTQTYIIQDIKSWPAIEKYKDDLPTPLQFVVYSLAVAKMFNVDVSQTRCQYELPISNELVDAGTRGFITRGKTKLLSLFDGINNTQFTPKPSTLCHWCEYCRTNPNAPSSSKWLCPYASSWTRERPMMICEVEFDNLEKYEEDLAAYKARHNVNT